eukprot:2920924-Rhodomonas_salina.1
MHSGMFATAKDALDALTSIASANSLTLVFSNSTTSTFDEPSPSELATAAFSAACFASSKLATVSPPTIIVLNTCWASLGRSQSGIGSGSSAPTPGSADSHVAFTTTPRDASSDANPPDTTAHSTSPARAV